ncbi:DDRGK domain-containing protein 1 isoform X1 [Brassica rapa]|uniref:DDRGK domain-containing protein 1 n=1 Tax=Brassica campestris TaxID=3711 RepID=M4EC68_BRACM|nr:DDRGK domain-containing protein 1 isoform X1 [Brassica rapa]
MEEIFALIVSMILIAAVIPLFLWKRRVDARSREEDAQPPLVQARENVVRATGGGGRRMRRRPAASAGASSSSSSNVQENISGSEDEEEEEEAIGNQARASKKKEKKRQEREEQRQAEEAARESRSTKQDWYAEMRRKKDEEREAEERKLEEEEKARQAKEEEAAALEFDKWKGEFSVDAEGTTEEVQGGNQDLLSEFVEYIKIQKCVPLEDLAAEFNLRTQECINRIASLESIGRLSGVMDDRGKYIYISMEEMNAVADYIKRQGRVSISHLASKSNQFIDLEPKVQDQLTEEISGMEEISVS